MLFNFILLNNLALFSLIFFNTVFNSFNYFIFWYTWFLIFLVCQTPPKNILNGTVIINYKPRTNKNAVGTIISFQCNEGYKLNSKNLVYFCRKNRTWNNDIYNLKCLKGKYGKYICIIKLLIGYKRLTFYVSCCKIT